MKVLYDHQTFVYQRFGGISRYFVELASSCDKLKDTSAEISVVVSDNVYLAEFPRNRSISVLGGKFPGRMTIYNFLNRLATIINIRFKKYDVFHPTYYDTYFLSALGNRPFVVTVYDMIHELFPGKWPNQEEITSNKSVLIRESTHIIAISEHTKKDLLHFYPDIPAEKVSVIWLGNSGLRQSGSNPKANARPYLLFVGKRDEYKNFKLLLNHIASYLLSDPHIHLIAAGGGSATEEEKKYILDLNIENSVTIIPFVEDSELAVLYENADAFIFPSSYEGFGIPILEAFEAGCPVILNNASCFPEIGGDAAMYYDDQKPETLLAVLETVRKDLSARSELIKKGKERLTLFSWEKTALKTVKVYQALIEEHGR